MRGRPDEAERIPEVPGAGAADHGYGRQADLALPPPSSIPNPNPESRLPDPGPIPTISPPCARWCSGGIARARSRGPFPDLILIDGGKGQLSAAYEALEAIGLANLVAVGIAKQEELLFTRDRMEPIVLAEHDPALLLLQRIRDEAHRFAVTFHRKARSMRDLRSELDGVPGIGPRRRRALLHDVRQPGGVRRATREELKAWSGRTRRARSSSTSPRRAGNEPRTPNPDSELRTLTVRP